MPIFIDPRSRASRPAQVPVRWTTYLRSHPVWPLLLGGSWAALTTQAFLTKQNGWAFAAVAVTLMIWNYVRTIHTVFSLGMLCPATVLSRKPLLVGVLTDLASTPEATRPVLKVFSPRGSKSFLPLGQRVAVVSTYSGSTAAGHWDDCHPQLAITANDEPALQEQLVESIAQSEWDQLTRACEEIPSPPKCGLYPVRAVES